MPSVYPEGSRMLSKPGCLRGVGDLGAVLERAQQRRIGHPEELVVVVAQRGEPRHLDGHSNSLPAEPVGRASRSGSSVLVSPPAISSDGMMVADFGSLLGGDGTGQP